MFYKTENRELLLYIFKTENELFLKKNTFKIEKTMIFHFYITENIEKLKIIHGL